jgi:uncharacterized damage-inducible protein DinB
MFRKVSDFKKTWAYESEETWKLLRSLTDASLAQAVGPDDRTLGRIAWHLTTTIGEMMGRTGLKVEGPGPEAPLPAAGRTIAESYEKASRSLSGALDAWNDDSLPIKDDMYGEQWTRGFTLFCLINHQAHHRGQMTVLMRQAGLKVHGVYGPAREEWSAMGVPAPEV